MSDIETPLQRVQRKFKDAFGIDVVEPTANGCWFEQVRYANGNELKNRKLTFITKSDLLNLSELIEEERRERDELVRG